jgi:hypothetical protein
MMKCYENLGQHKKAAEINDHIFELIRTDERSTKMYCKYGYLLDDIHVPEIDDDSAEDWHGVKLEAPVLGEKEMRVKPLMANTGNPSH